MLKICRNKVEHKLYNNNNNNNNNNNPALSTKIGTKIYVILKTITNNNW